MEEFTFVESSNKDLQNLIEQVINEEKAALQALSEKDLKLIDFSQQELQDLLVALGKKDLNLNLSPKDLEDILEQIKKDDINYSELSTEELQSLIDQVTHAISNETVRGLIDVAPPGPKPEGGVAVDVAGLKPDAVVAGAVHAGAGAGAVVAGAAKPEGPGVVVVAPPGPKPEGPGVVAVAPGPKPDADVAVALASGKVNLNNHMLVANGLIVAAGKTTLNAAVVSSKIDVINKSVLAFDTNRQIVNQKSTEQIQTIKSRLQLQRDDKVVQLSSAKSLIKQDAGTKKTEANKTKDSKQNDVTVKDSETINIIKQQYTLTKKLLESKANDAHKLNTQKYNDSLQMLKNLAIEKKK
jgi:hypothetical protein